MENLEISHYIETLTSTQKEFYFQIESILKSIDPNICRIIFVHQPYFYLSRYESIKPHHRPSVMLSFFGDHMNIFALATRHHRPELEAYKITEKHTLQINFKQTLPIDVLRCIFEESLNPSKGDDK